MKKSKFLKKSLAMLLAVMLVVAMIPLSAAAAPSATFTPAPAAGQEATVTKSDDNWTMAFKYVANPSITFEKNDGEVVTYVNDQDQTVTYTAGSTIALPKDDNGNPEVFNFTVKNGDDTTNHSITWTVESASSTVSVKSAKYGNYGGVVNEAARTIAFTVPFGYTTGKSASDVKVTFEGARQTSEQSPASITPETNTRKGVAGSITVQPQSNDNDVTYTVTVEEEEGLASIKIGDYEGVFTTKPSGNDKGYEDGNIVFSVPADIAPDSEGKLELPISYTVGSDFTGLTIDDVNEEFGTPKSLTSGEEYDFAALINGNKTLTITNANGNRTYTLVFDKNKSDTAITKAEVTVAGVKYEAALDGENISVVVPANATFTTVDVKLTGPKAVSTGAKVTGLGSAGNFDSNGEFSANAVSYTAPIRFYITSEDGKTNTYYTLTVSKAEEENNDPQITSAKMIVDKGQDTEAEYTASISGTTITFNVPYSLLDNKIAAADFTFAKTAQTNLDQATDLIKGNLKNGGSVVIRSADNATKRTYTIVYNRASAQTGKSISDFEVSTAGNANLKGYNNSKTYDVTVSGDKFTVTLPTNVGTLYPSFTLSEGAKLYKVANVNATVSTTDEVKGYDSKTGNHGPAIDPKSDETAKTIYFVADEYLATAIANNELTGKTYDQIKNANGTHLAEYAFDATTSDRSGKRLSAISADDGKVTGTISGTDITLNVPYSYAELGNNNTTFYFDFTVSEGASLKSNTVTLISGGQKGWSNGELTDGPASGSNPNFQIKKVGNDDYDLYIFNGTDYNTAATGIQVVAEDGTVTPYAIKKINAADAQTGAAITSLKVNNTTASINGTKITAGLPYGTNLGQVKIDITASEMATVYEADGVTKYDPDKNYDLTSPLKFQVVSEDTKFTNVYTLTATTAAQFSDVSTDDWFYQNVMDAVAAGIVSGRGDGTFGPNDRITRRDFAIMVSKLLLDGEDAPEATTTPFSDVSADDYALNAIAYCAENGIISGFDGEFRPGDNITRQEAASVMKNALELTGTTSELFADDAAIATWAKANVYACKAAGVFNGDDHNNFNPTSTLTRAEAASIMVNAMK